MKPIATKIRDSFGGRTAGGDREESLKKIAEARQAGEKEMNGILSADQSKRLNEIVLQQTGSMTALGRDEVAKEVGLSDDQQAKIKEIRETFVTEMRGQFQAGGGGNPQEAVKKVETLRKESNDKVLAILKDDQKKAWEKLVGEPFKGEIQPFGGNRPRNKTAQ